MTESTEMYLLTIYRLTEKNPITSIRDISERMSVSLSSTSEKIKRLAEQGYVLHEWREGVSLADEGRTIALRLIRKHRLIETFLVYMAGYAIDEVHEDACRLEHCLSERLTDSLENMLGYPAVDCYGRPIPTKNGTMTQPEDKPLASISSGKDVTICRLGDFDRERLQYLRELGLLPGVEVYVFAIAPFEGPLTLHIEDNTIALAYAIAQEVYVCEKQKP